MKWYKPDVDEVLFSGAEARAGKRVGVLANTYSSHYFNFPESNEVPINYDEILLKCLDEADILDLGWIKKEDSKQSYHFENWLLCISGDGVLIAYDGVYPNEMEFIIKNKQQLKLLMQFLGIN